jgi:glycosyltransferase involved in cell wall biosynthesis
MTRICLVGNEIHPTTPGGAGSLVFHLAKTLIGEGHEIIFLLDLSKDAFLRFERADRFLLPNPSKSRVFHVDTLCARIPYHEDDFPSRYLWESYRFDYAARQVYELEKPDLFEFVDYCGPAYFALCAKIAGLSYQNARIVVRIHGSVESIDRRTLAKPINFDRYTIYALEHYSLRLAESVLYPTTSSLQEYQSGEHDPWFGETILAEPVSTEQLHRDREEPGANIILFYGRLFAVKGVDQFVDAAILLLLENPDSPLEFYLVGYDSMDPQVEEQISYQEYLLRKVPEKFRERFIFTGFISQNQLEEFLPRVKFAVFPSLYESFCLAAHELRRARIPFILSKIPAFQDHFVPDVDALYFDGSVSDLVEKMKLLDADLSARQALSQPFFTEPSDKYSFYGTVPRPSWMKPDREYIPSGILICILDEERNDDLVAQSLDSIGKDQIEDLQIIILRKCQGNANQQSAYWIFGSWYEFFTHDFKQIVPFSVRTKGTLLILRSGDKITPGFIPLSLRILSRQPRISFVGSWKWICLGARKWLYTHPVAAMVELTPLETISAFNRCVMRTPSEISFITLFDQNDRNLAEASYLWKLDTNQTCGIQIPEPGVWQAVEPFTSEYDGELSRLVLQAHSPSMSANLSRYLTMLVSVYPSHLLPLKAYWASKSGSQSFLNPVSKPMIITKQNWRSRISKNLSRGGPFSQRLLVILRRGKSILRKIF